jgi:hypothetical protein
VGQLTSIDCNVSTVPTGNRSTNTTTRAVTFSIAAGETLDCTFTNTKQQGHIVIDKVTDPPGDPTSFDFTLNGGPSNLDQSFQLTDQSTPYDSGPILPGSGYAVAETVPDGWDQTAKCTSTDSNDASTPSNISLGANETVTCTFTNTKKTTSISTSQSFTPQDTVTIGGTGSGTPNGTVDFELYKGEVCTGTPVYFEKGVSLDADGTKKTTNGDPENLPNHSAPYTISDEGTSQYYWKVTYHGGTSGHPDASSCVEESTVTIDNGNTTP